MKKTNLIIILFLFLLPVVTATFSNEWGEYGDSPTRRGFVGDEVGQWNGTGSRTFIADGADFSPLAIDADNDTLMNIIGSDGNFLKIWEVNSNGALVLDDELNFGATQTVTMTALLDSYDADDYREFLVIFGTNISVVEYDGTSINIECSNTTIANAVTGAACGNFSGTIGCYFANNGGNISEFNAKTCNIGLLLNAGGTDLFSTDQGTKQAPAMGDIDRDNSQELVFACDSSNDNSEDLCVYDITSATHEFNVSISPTGVSSDVRIQGSLIWNLGGQPFSYNSCIDTCKQQYPLWWRIWTSAFSIDEYTTCQETCESQYLASAFGGGDSEIITTWKEVGGAFADQNTNILVTRSDGSQLWTDEVKDDGSSGSTYHISPPIIMGTQFNDDTNNIYICTITEDDGATDRSYIDCYDEFGVKVYGELTPLGATIYGRGSTIASASLTDVVDNNFDLVVSNAIVNLDTSTNTSTFYNFSGTAQSNNNNNIILVDANKDHNLDVCGQKANAVFCAYSPYINSPPTINNTIAFGGYGYSLDVEKPICVNDTVTFSARECGGTNTNCNYANDINEDLERIVSNCGQTSTGAPSNIFTQNLANGTFVGSSISNYSCLYNTTGTFSVRLYLQDDSNVGDFTTFNAETIPIQVVKGTRGIDCSFVISTQPGEGTPVTSSASQQAVDSSITSTLGILFGTSNKMKNIMAIGIILGILVAVAQITKNGMAIVASAMLSLALVTFIGLLTPWVLIVLLVSMVLLLIMGNFVTGSTSTE